MGDDVAKAASGFLGLSPLGWLGAGANLLGGIFGNQGFTQARNDINALTKYNPMSANIGGGGFMMGPNGAQFMENFQTAGMRNLLGGAGAQGLMGGMFNDPNLQNALSQNNMQGAMDAATQANSMFANPQMASQLGAIGSLGGAWANQAMQGPQDYSGGMQGNMFGMGMQNMMQAGNFSDAYNQQLDVLRQSAAPQFQKDYNSLENRLFAQGRLGSTGGAGQMGAFFDSKNQADLGFQRQAFDQALGKSTFLGNLGLGQMGQGGNLMATNLNQFQNLNQNAMSALGMGAGMEQNFFNNQISAINQAQTAGQNRLMNAMNLFGLGTSTQNQGFNQGIMASNALQGMDQNQITGILGLLNAEANRIGATGMHAQALGQTAQGQGGFLGGIFGGLFS